ncbi:MAG: hypothetical protein AB1757_00240 [Acidobacteriota bacterium]
MSMITVPNRPFSTDRITGLMLPDGIFESTLGKQRINAQFKNVGASTVNNTQIYIESVSHPGIVFTPTTYLLNTLTSGAVRVFSWEADFSAVPPGVHYISFISENAAGRNRTIKKIFVTRVTFDPATKTFSAQTPEGVIEVQFEDLVGPKTAPCCCKRHRKPPNRERNFLSVLSAFTDHRDDFEFCLPGYLPHRFRVGVSPNPPFAGQYGDLPFEDPWWKIILCIIAALLLIAAAIAEAVDGSGEITVSGGSSDGDSGGDCCGVRGEGSGTSYVAAGLTAAAAAVATAAALSDARDPFRRGQDNTLPAAGEVTTAELLEATISYPEPVALGRPFAAHAKWEYTRVTTGASYNYSVSETNNNIHTLSRYQITAPDVVRLYKRELFIVRAEFFDEEDRPLRGGDLFVQCFLVGPQGQFRSFGLQDDGINPDDKPSDGIYTGVYLFSREKDPRGLWKYFVIAQDINTAQPNMTPEEAAQIIGGMVVTHQLTISFTGGECPLVPDGDVNVIG